MINVLPPDVKRSYRYAEANVKLVRWVVTGFVSLVGLSLIATYGWLSLHQATANTNQQIDSIQASLQTAKLTATDKQVTDISNSLKLVQKVLGQEILFSKLLMQMAASLPNGANLTGLDIAKVSGGSGLDVTAEATSYAVASQVQVNLADTANGIFAKADINSVSCDPSAASDPKYPCKISLRAQFAQNNPFLFINQKPAKS